MTEVIPFITAMPSRVRWATADDAADVLAMCRRQHAEEGYPFRFSDDRNAYYIRRGVSKDGGILGVIGEPGALQASTYMDISQPHYSEDWALHDLWLYVQPEYRASSNTRDLIAFQKWCEATTRLPLVTAMISSVNTATKIRLYRKSYGEPIGAVFLHSSQARA